MRMFLPLGLAAAVSVLGGCGVDTSGTEDDGGTGGGGGSAAATGGRGAGSGGRTGGPGTGGSTGGGGATLLGPCTSTANCSNGEVCTTEDGACNSAPGCSGDGGCPNVCFGTCRVAGPVSSESCGGTLCGPGSRCCNESCGVCMPTEMQACDKQACAPPQCRTDGDCRATADYCTGCDCRALGPGENLPACPGPGVRCFADPCGNAVARCRNNRCVAATR
jgi:hypothetical protein